MTPKVTRITCREPQQPVACEKVGDAKLSSRDVTETSSFRRWFGDSKVVDNGCPLVVYHGTDKDFTTFKRGRDLGFHFGDAEAANQRMVDARSGGAEDPVVGEIVMPVYLSIRKPLCLEDTFGSTFHSVEDTIRQLFLQGIISEDAASSLVDRKAIESNDPEVISEAWARVQDEIERAGYDGVFYENEMEGGESFIAFRPEQIKSAIGNSGAFDPNNSDICDSPWSAERAPLRWWEDADDGGLAL